MGENVMDFHPLLFLKVLVIACQCCNYLLLIVLNAVIIIKLR